MVNAWKNYLKWEEGNPLVIEDEELKSQRIGYALRKCLGEMRHFPELWCVLSVCDRHQVDSRYYAVSYYSSSGKSEETVEVVRAGVQACPTRYALFNSGLCGNG